MIATIRSGEPLGDATHALTLGDRVYRADLRLFREDQVAEVLRAALSGAVGQRTVRTLWSKSKGNALYLREMVQGAASAGMLVSDGEIWEIAEGGLPSSPRLTELISLRLATADPESRKLLELLSLCEPLSAEEAAVDLSVDQLNSLEETGIIQIRQDRRRLTLSLAHPLYGESLRASIPTLRRRELLASQISRTKSHGARRREDALRLATWELLAFGTADAELLVRAAILANHSHDYDRVIALLAGLPKSGQSYESLLLQGTALLHVGRWQEADEILATGESYASGEAQRATVTLQRTWSLFWIAGKTELALRVNQAARHNLQDERWIQVLKLNDASLRALSGQHHGSLAMLLDLEADFNGEPSIAAWSLAAMAKSASLAQMGRLNDAVAFGQQAYAAHQRLDETVLGVPIPAGQLVPVGYALADAGELDMSRHTLANVLAVTEGTDNAVTWVWASFFRGRTEWLAGDVEAARGWFAQAAARARTYHYVQPLFRALGGLAACAAVLGDLDASLAAIEEMQLYPPMGLHAGEEDLGQAWLHAARGDARKARATLGHAASKARAAGDVTAEIILLTDIARLGGACDVAERLNKLATLCDGSFSRARARLAAALAADDAVQLQGVADELQAIGVNLLAAEAANAAAAVWRRAGNPRRATAAANQAAACSVHCAGARTVLLSATEAMTLTAREREVALLAAVGNSSKEIAEVLQLSVRTVDNHLQHTYSKLGISTRRELAVFFKPRPIRHGALFTGLTSPSLDPKS
ncbi:LuxR C-terminal-related transcriptional regulator [Streptomyces collinus]|uniref:helix-turn-helix transcriptional regulator n=1 Tax=Streptomyces collinus TaxID=42684 RepID=UPI0036844090